MSGSLLRLTPEQLREKFAPEDRSVTITEGLIALRDAMAAEVKGVFARILDQRDDAWDELITWRRAADAEISSAQAAVAPLEKKLKELEAQVNTTVLRISTISLLVPLITDEDLRQRFWNVLGGEEAEK